MRATLERRRRDVEAVRRCRSRVGPTEYPCSFSAPRNDPEMRERKQFPGYSAIKFTSAVLYKNGYSIRW